MTAAAIALTELSVCGTISPLSAVSVSVSALCCLPHRSLALDLGANTSKTNGLLGCR